ncbi:MAG: hypothetical protein JOZ41_03500, partial [Chloroflexi bacterium]|nr:hypothetical protein [Chloroflexota bacterium]
GRITLRTVQGTTASYALSKNVTVTRTVADTRGDLRVGETVRIGARPGSTTAFSVTIESG